MGQVAKLFNNGRSQAVRLPLAYRFNSDTVFIRRDPNTGDVILSSRPDNWDDFLELLKATEVPEDFLQPSERPTTVQPRDPFDGWTE